MTASVAPAQSARLPLWRTITGFAILGSLVAVLLALGPAYVQNDRFTRRVKSTVAGNAMATEETLRSALVNEARSFALPVLPGDVKITHTEGNVEVQVKYNVEKNLGLYQVDLHFHPFAKAPSPKVK